MFSSYFFNIWALKEGKKGTEFKEGFANLIFNPGVELKIFLSLTAAYDCGNFPHRPIIGWNILKTVTS